MGNECTAAPTLPALPYISHAIVHHVGHMDRAAKGTTHNSHSLEGQHLSVSRHPEAWCHIAKLGGAPTWSIAPEGDAGAMRFVDVLSMNTEQWSEVTLWGQTQGLALPAWIHRFFYWDDELDCEVYQSAEEADVGALASARAEHESRLVEEWEGVRTEVIIGWRATDDLVKRVGFNVPAEDVPDMVLGCFAQDVLWSSNNTVGLWWNEKLDPFAYSAPRGCIHQSALDSGQLQIEIDPSACDQGDESAAEEDDLQESTRMAQR